MSALCQLPSLGQAEHATYASQKTAAQSNMFNLDKFIHRRNEMTTNVIKQIIKVGFGTPNSKTWNISQLQKEA